MTGLVTVTGPDPDGRLRLGGLAGDGCRFGAHRWALSRHRS